MFGQNDLVHAWGLDFQLGYCAQAIFPSYDHTRAQTYFNLFIPWANFLCAKQGDRTKNIGIVDSEYIIHYGLPTLGGSVANKVRTLLLLIQLNHNPNSVGMG